MIAQPKILIVESDAALRASLQFALELEGFAVEAFAGDEILESKGTGAANCVVIDHCLPAAGGVPLLEQLRKRGLSCQAIFTASNPNRALRASIAAAGAVLVEKPFLCDGLLAAIRAALPCADKAA
jgi:two-component system, LuxR family, response regulator FixJ